MSDTAFFATLFGLLGALMTVPLWGPSAWDAIVDFRGRSDRAAKIFAKVVELLNSRPDDWESDGCRLVLRGTKIGIWTANRDYGLSVSTANGNHFSPNDGLRPKQYWRRKLWKAVQRREQDLKLVRELNHISDQMAALIDSENVVAFRGRNING